MRSAVPMVVLAALLAGCSVDPSSSPVAGQLLQPLPMLPPFPPHVGRSEGAKLGTSVAGCRVPGFVAGAPGENATFLFRDGGLWLASPLPYDAGDALGIAVGCEGGPTNLKVVSGGWSGVWTRTLPAGTTSFVIGGPVETLEPGPLPPATPAALLVGKPASGEVELFTVTATGYFPVTGLLPAVPAAGSAFAWDPAGTFFVVGNPMTSSVQFYGWAPNGASGTAAPGLVLPGPVSSGFGMALAIGDVHPNPGLELIVGAPWSSQVFIYGTPGMGQPLPPLLMVLDALPTAAMGGFGTSLAIEPTPVSGGTLRALWVGDPLNAQIVRFVGDAGQPVTSLEAASYFGFSLAVTEQTLVVGAPFYGDSQANQGAVYTLPFGTMPLANSEPKPCSGGCVTSNCYLGRCIGGVICQATLNPTCAGGTCNAGVCTFPPDAGRTDAGEVDAGEADAGELDAGELDAGEADAGELDAGEADAGEADAGAPDAGELDAGTPDAGQPDAGRLDGGTGADRSVSKFRTCGCSGAGAIPLVLLSMLWSRRRRAQGLSGPR